MIISHISYLKNTPGIYLLEVFFCDFMQKRLVINNSFGKILSMKVNYVIQNRSQTIDNVLSELDDLGFGFANDSFNFIGEVRGWMGEEDFYKFLEDLVTTWDIDSVLHHFE